MEMFSLHFSPGTHGDVFTPFGTKVLLQNLEAPASEESIFSLSIGLPLGTLGFWAIQ